MIKWDPELGKLFVREIWHNELLIESHLACIVSPRKQPQAALQYIMLLGYQHGITSPIGTGCLYVDFVTGNQDMLTEFHKVCRRLALDEDIHFLLKAWDTKERIQPDNWIDKINKRYVEDEKLLNSEEFVRLLLVTEKYFGHPYNRHTR